MTKFMEDEYEEQKKFGLNVIAVFVTCDPLPFQCIFIIHILEAGRHCDCRPSVLEQCIIWSTGVQH